MDVKISDLKKDNTFNILVKDNRIGKFVIRDIEFENDLDEILKNIFSRIFIVRAEHLYHRMVMEYVGYCDLFEKVRFGSETPEYEFIFSKQSNENILIDVKKIK